MTDDGIVVASKTPPGHRCGWCGGASKSGYVYHFNIRALTLARSAAGTAPRLSTGLGARLTPTKLAAVHSRRFGPAAARRNDASKFTAI